MGIKIGDIVQHDGYDCDHETGDTGKVLSIDAEGYVEMEAIQMRHYSKGQTSWSHPDNLTVIGSSVEPKPTKAQVKAAVRQPVKVG